MIKKVTAMFFSPTGTTKKVCTRIAEAISEKTGAEYEETGFTKPGARKREFAFGSENLVVFGTPVYAGRVPNVLIDFIKSVKFAGSLAVPIVLFGNRNYDDALKELSDTLKKGGARIAGAGAFVGEHAFSDVLAKGRPDEEDMMLADKLASKVAELVKDHGASVDGVAADYAGAFEDVEVPGEEPLRPYYKPRDSKGEFIDIRKVVPETSTACDGCGICVEVCPMGSIDPMRVSRIKGICIKCCACVKRCPRGAKYFDDPGFLYHKEELEKMYERRSVSEIFV